ncbi:hypothetical protein DEO72_LG2g4045 [Vigna unguiculata]|uniref:Uncharacterized protein n=1 Tax=Vigna unguiculata TaxID=3917 RepID=A0A4D6L5C0_VIGUN|nr:hypothetical protein DEO72_LG2g4045 [Vigna unguiculata]
MFEFFVAYHVVKDLAAADAAASPIVVATMWAECESEALIVVLNPVVVTIVNEPLRRKTIASPGDYYCCKSSKFFTEWLRFTLESRQNSSFIASIHTRGQKSSPFDLVLICLDSGTENVMVQWGLSCEGSFGKFIHSQRYWYKKHFDVCILCQEVLGADSLSLGGESRNVGP